MSSLQRYDVGPSQMGDVPALSLPGRLEAIARQATRRLDAKTVAYSSFRGHFSDNPRAIFEELVSRSAGLTHLWVAEQNRAFPDDVVQLETGTRSYFDALGRAKYVVANHSMPQLAPKKGRVYLQTWHGTPLKRIGFDNGNRTAAGLRRAAFDYRQWTFLVSQNRHSSDVFRRAFRFDGEMLEYGYPRNDVLSSPSAPAIREATRRAIGVEDGTVAVLYAPTFRDAAQGGRRFSLELDVERVGEALGEGYTVLLRLHHWVAEALHLEDRAASARWRDVSTYPDIRDLYLAADMMITDYSSVMFDFAVTSKPMAFFTYDLGEYRDSLRGMYFDITEKAPGPLCATSDEVIEVVRNVEGLGSEYESRYRDFRSEFCPHDDGFAAKRVADHVFARR